MITIRQLEAVRTLLSNALDICTEQEVQGALIQGMDEIAAMQMDLVTADVERGAITEQLTSRFDSPAAPTSFSTEVWDLAVSLNEAAKIGMGVTS